MYAGGKNTKNTWDLMAVHYVQVTKVLYVVFLLLIYTKIYIRLNIYKAKIKYAYYLQHG